MADELGNGDRAPSASEPLLSGRRAWLRVRWPSAARSFALKTSVWSELGGAVGDLGTFIPIVLALSLSCGLDLGTALVFTALYNALTGLLFGLPMPVQPMKSIAAVAIASSPPLPLPAIAAAGLSVAAALFLLGASGLMSSLYRLLPLPVVRGVQLSQGLSFTFSALSYIRFLQPFSSPSNSLSSSSSSSSSDPRPWLGLDGIVLALSALLFLLLTTGAGADDDDDSRSGDSRTRGRGRGRGRRACALIPSALIVFLLGLALCFVRDPSVLAQIKLGPSPLRVVRITWDDFKLGFFRAAIPQLPLSILNSVIAVCKLSADLFPDRPEGPVSVAAVSVSVGAMNLVGCWFGAVPVCHGAGGLAGQYRFGGRSGAAVLFLAAGKLLLGLLFGASFVRILREFPVGILGVLLLFSGIELAMAARDVSGKEEAFVMLACAAVSMASSGGAAMGFICGLAVFVVLRVREVDWLALVANFRIPGFGGRNGRRAPAPTAATPKAEEAGADA
ncbi:molybdate transporter 2 [Ananas comosus]|uniref:Molybdate transporter 2 n=1 Tax=Ananas comosus TaxID=4615 RepID=A0A199UG26_ANACO|nr:molybdate transporter 2 [Ananas comosus]OAY63689.1 Molybdate transporter 2 [Ananas comosus]